MSLSAYTDPNDRSTKITAQEYSALPVYKRGKVYCGGINRQKEICTCPMHFRSASAIQSACFAANDVDLHIKGCPNCEDIKRRTIAINFDGEKMTVDDLFARMCAPAQERPERQEPDDPQDTGDDLPTDEIPLDRREIVYAAARLPLNAPELYDYIQNNYDLENGDAELSRIVLDADTIGDYWLDNLEGKRLVKVYKENKHYYSFPPTDPMTRTYDKGSFTISLSVDGAPNVKIKFMFKNRNSHIYTPRRGQFPPIFKHAISIKNQMREDENACLAAFVDLKYVGAEDNQYIYAADITSKHQIGFINM